MVNRLHAHGGPVTPENFKEMILSTGQEVALRGRISISRSAVP
jgi:hypothetical protein